MINPENILGIIENNSKKENFRHKKLYKNLYNTDFYLNAYARIYNKEGNMTKGTDGNTIDGFSIDRVNKLIESMRNESYVPSPTKRIYIPKAKGGKRPLGIPSVNDKLVQEIVRQLLDSIYDVNFEENSHGFRSGRSCHTALKDISNKSTGVKWWIEGDIKGFFDNINHEVLINILREKIDDDRFIRLIRKFLNAGYIENNNYHNSYSGTPQGSIISPILSNIILDKFDKFMNNLIEEFNKGDARKPNKEYRSIQNKKLKCQQKIKNGEYKDDIELQLLKRKFKEYENKQRNLNSKDLMDENFKRLTYTRYADDFLVGVIGSKEDCVDIKNKINEFMLNTLKLELSWEKTKITNSKNRVRFLGYDILQSKKSIIKKLNDGRKQRVMSGITQLLIPFEVMRDFLLKTDSLIIKKDGLWKAKHRAKLLNNDALEILTTYNSEIRGFYNYYCLANNSHKINKIFGIFKHSFIKTLGMKYRGNKETIKKNHLHKGKWGSWFTNSKGEKVFRELYNDGFKRKDYAITLSNLDILPSNIRNSARTSLMDRLKANKCELCNKTDGNFEVHHIRKLKDIKDGKSSWEKHMIARNRKTMVLCVECHKNIHRNR